MTFSGNDANADSALAIAHENGYDVQRVSPMYLTPDEQTLTWIELTDVLTEFGADRGEWAGATLARAQRILEPLGFRLRAHGSPAGRARRIPQSATLRDADTHEALRSASFEEWLSAVQTPAPGIIEVDGHHCVVTDDD